MKKNIKKEIEELFEEMETDIMADIDKLTLISAILDEYKSERPIINIYIGVDKDV